MSLLTYGRPIHPVLCIVPSMVGHYIIKGKGKGHGL